MANIIIVDDSPGSAVPLSRLLKYAGHHVETLLCSGDAMGLLREHQPDLLLLDVGMPQINGIELLREIRNDEQLRDLPVLIYSAMSDPKIVSEAEALGAKEYLVKGAGMEPLLERIGKYLPKN
jgi:CheY-like chemotaxis protein